MSTIITRIAPSPTGALHIGTARTALFNYLFAHKHGGRFVLRIEDTDTQRSEKAFEDDITAGLAWLDITWDGDVIRQSERTDVYRSYAEKLLKSGAAYTEKGASGGEAIILRAPDEDITFRDVIRGDITFEKSERKDIVLIKSDGTPTYHLAVVVDDYESGITHVIRGEDHISNTPKHITIQNALSFSRPTYAHLPLILGPDRSKLSKRHGAVSISTYRDAGYLPEAFVNMLALLGWNPGDDREIFTPEELKDEFSLERIQKGGAVFNHDKLDWVSRRHIERLSDAELTQRILSFIKTQNKTAQREHIHERTVGLIRERIVKLSDVYDELVWFDPPAYPTEMLVWKETPRETTQKHLQAVRDIVAKLPDSPSDKQAESALMPFADEQGRGAVLWPLRVALSGAERSPGPFELIALVGRDAALQRIDNAIEKL